MPRCGKWIGALVLLLATRERATADIITLDVPGGSDTRPTGVSGGMVVGNYMTGSTYAAFLYNGSTFSTFSVPGALATYASTN